MRAIVTAPVKPSIESTSSMVISVSRSETTAHYPTEPMTTATSRSEPTLRSSWLGPHGDAFDGDDGGRQQAQHREPVDHVEHNLHQLASSLGIGFLRGPVRRGTTVEWRRRVLEIGEPAEPIAQGSRRRSTPVVIS